MAINPPSFSNILNDKIIIKSQTIVNKDGSYQSYCGLKLINIPDIGKHTKHVLHVLLTFLQLNCQYELNMLLQANHHNRLLHSETAGV